MSKINATIVGDSLSPQGHRMCTVLGVIPRIVLAELNTHRMFSRNSASSRAIPSKRMIEMVRTNPFIPIAWQKEHTGMQGTEYITNSFGINVRNGMWLSALDKAIDAATMLSETLSYSAGSTNYNPIDLTDAEGGAAVTKQITNRLLEPFMWHTVLITATEWENFFELRCPQYDIGNGILYRSKKDAIKAIKAQGIDTTIGEMFFTDLKWLQHNKGGAEIHISTFAECIWDAMNGSTPKQLKAGEWHIPFGDKIDTEQLKTAFLGDYSANILDELLIGGMAAKVKVSTAMAARTSYTTVGDEKEISYERLVGIHDKMEIAKPFHASPFEHCNRCMSEDEHKAFTKTFPVDNETNDIHKVQRGWCYNMRGFIPYRYMLENK